jgi:hypothetical protein
MLTHVHQQVANHLGAGPGWTPSAANGPFDTESHFHPFCTPEDWENQHEVEQCEPCINVAYLGNTDLLL